MAYHIHNLISLELYSWLHWNHIGLFIRLFKKNSFNLFQKIKINFKLKMILVLRYINSEWNLTLSFNKAKNEGNAKLRGSSVWLSRRHFPWIFHGCRVWPILSCCLFFWNLSDNSFARYQLCRDFWSSGKPWSLV